jgi:drug/metabolite transporter (DMT)-like permease
VVGVLLGVVAMGFVGGSAAVSGRLDGTSIAVTQSMRYAVACLLLVGMARLARRRVERPRGAEWLWLGGVTGAGLVLFNVALVRGAAHAEPALYGVAVACVPLLLAVLGPVLDGGRPARAALPAAAVVTLGAALVQGTGRGDAVGLVWAAVVLACEAAFTLAAVPVLRRHGPWGVSVHTTWMAAAVFAVGIPFDPRRPGAAELAATAYLAVAVTAVAFVLWYSCVRRYGAGRAGLLTGIAPVAAAGAGVALGAPVPGPMVWVGIAVVAAGIALGLRPAPAPLGDPAAHPDPLPA